MWETTRKFKTAFWSLPAPSLGIVFISCFCEYESAFDYPNGITCENVQLYLRNQFQSILIKRENKEINCFQVLNRISCGDRWRFSDWRPAENAWKSGPEKSSQSRENRRQLKIGCRSFVIFATTCNCYTLRSLWIPVIVVYVWAFKRWALYYYN